MNTGEPSRKWQDVVRRQGRTFRWLADQTGKSKWTVYRYSTGERRATDEWLVLVSMVLGEQVTR